MSARYWIYGIGLESDFAFPYARSSRPGIAEIRLREWTEIHSPIKPPTSFAEPFLFHHASDGTTYLLWPGLFEFQISQDGRDVRGRGLSKDSLESFHTYLLGPVLSYALLKHGIEQLHATVVSIEGRGLALTGDCGRGKSTLAAALLKQGAKLLVDDMLVVRKKDDASWLAYPGPPRLKLMPDAAAQHGMDALGAVPMNPFVPKKVFPVAGHESDPVPLRKIFVLDAPDPSTKELKIRRCSPAEACIQVVAAAYNLDTTVRSRSQSQLKYAASIAETVDVSVVSYPRELSHVDRVAEAVSASFLQ